MWVRLCKAIATVCNHGHLTLRQLQLTEVGDPRNCDKFNLSMPEVNQLNRPSSLNDPSDYGCVHPNLKIVSVQQVHS